MLAQSASSSSPAAASGALRGALWMVAACIGLGAMNVLIRHLSLSLHPFEIAFFRCLGQVVFMVPWIVARGVARMRTDRLRFHALRSAVGLTAMLFWFSALALMPVAEATALSFTAPLFATVGAALILGETVRVRRWSATAVGFLGALIILRPGISQFTWAAGLALTSAAFMAGSALTVKSLSRTDSPNVIVIYMGLFMTPVSLLPALFVWQTPGLETALWLVVLGALATVSHLMLNRAFAAADASAVLPFDFVRLPAAAVLAYLAFGEVADLWTWVGGAVIFGSSIYIARRESRHGRTAPGPAAAVVAEARRPEPLP